MRKLPVYIAILIGALPPLGTITAAFAADADAGGISYANNCAACHNTPGSAWNVSTQTLQQAIQSNRGGMGWLSGLSVTDLQNIAAYLANPSATVAATNKPTTAVPDAADRDAERIFDWAELTNPQLFNSHGVSENLEGYRLRYYPGTGIYLGAKNGQLYYYNTRRPQEGILSLGPLTDWLKKLVPTPPARPNDDDNDREGGENH